MGRRHGRAAAQSRAGSCREQDGTSGATRGERGVGIAIYNTFNVQRHLIGRSTLRLFRADADRRWAEATVAA
jgi:hypothetical protein